MILQVIRICEKISYMPLFIVKFIFLKIYLLYFSFGDKVLILDPKELKDDRKKQAENILKMCEGNEQHDI